MTTEGYRGRSVIPLLTSVLDQSSIVDGCWS